jgi:hypothetical protein
LLIGNRDRRRDPPSGTPATLHGGAARLDDLKEIVEDTIGHVFVKDPLIPESLKIKLQTLEFDTLLVRHIPKYQNPEIRLTGLRADRSEFRTSDFDGILSVGVRVLEALELFGKRCSRHGRQVG